MPEESGGLRALARRHPIALYLTLVFGLGYPLMALSILASRGIIPGATMLARFGLDSEKAPGLVLTLATLLPAALIVTALEGGRPAVRALFRRMFRWRFGAGWWVFILVALPAATIGLSLVLGDRFVRPTVETLLAELGGLLAGFALVNFWEEASWAGFMQTRLERRYHLYAAAALTAVPFAAIHMPLQFASGTPSLGALLGNFAVLTVVGVVVRSYFGLVMRGTADSLLAVGLAHTIFNRSTSGDGIAARLLEGGHHVAAALLATLLLTVALGVLLRRRTASGERARLDSQA